VESTPASNRPVRSTAPAAGAVANEMAMRGRALSGAQLFGGVGFLCAFLFMRPPGLEGVKNGIVFPVLAIVSWALFGLQRRQPRHIWRWAGLTFGVYAAYLIGELGFCLFWLDRVSREDIRVLITVLLPWISVLNVIAFVIFPPRIAVRAAVGYSFIQAAQAGAYLAMRDPAPDRMLINAFAQQFVLAPVLYIVLLQYTKSLAEAFAEARVMSTRFEALALTDELTGLPNRRATHLALDKAMAHHGRGVLAAGAIMVDIDHFKRVNDQFGHDVGDLALQHIARVLAQVTRRSQTIGRWGGEEFLIVLSDKPPLEVATLMERVRTAVANAPLANPTVHLTVSLGAAIAGPDDSAEAVVRRADAALYEAKASGRNRAVLAPPLAG
jgi:diguanylate cyclase (GGDEF)-like protein